MRGSERMGRRTRPFGRRGTGPQLQRANGDPCALQAQIGQRDLNGEALARSAKRPTVPGPGLLAVTIVVHRTEGDQLTSVGASWS